MSAKDENKVVPLKPAEDWRSKLMLGERGRPLGHEANICIALRNAPELKGRLRFNELTSTVECHDLPWGSGPPSWRAWIDRDDGQLAEHLQLKGLRVSVNVCATAAAIVAHDAPTHPVRDYLDNIRWDGKPRLNTWLQVYLGATVEDGRADFLCCIGRCFLVSAVARIYRPGCKVDTCIVLEGEQGAGKSRALAALVPEPAWFTDGLADIGSKDAAQDLRGKWLIEVAELSAMRRPEIERVKAFMSRDTDHYRPSYGRHSRDFPRQCAFAGTTNADSYLTDETGGRRYWPVHTGAIDVDAIVRDRNQLWAEAVVAFEAGEPWWLDHSTERLARAEQKDRQQQDPWEPAIAAYVADRADTAVSEIMERALHLTLERQDQTTQNRVARILKGMGWNRIQKRVNGKHAWRYSRPEAEADR